MTNKMIENMVDLVKSLKEKNLVAYIQYELLLHNFGLLMKFKKKTCHQHR